MEQSRDKNLAGSLGRGILDCACTKTVAGKAWVDEFVEMLQKKEREEVKKSSRKSPSLYRFGDGHENKSLEETCCNSLEIFGDENE